MPKNNYIINLKGVYDNKPRTRRANYAIREIYNFLKKHTRKDKSNIILSNEVNNFIWKNSIQRPPRKIEISLKFKDDEVFVFLKDSKAYKDFGKSTEPVKKQSIKDQVKDRLNTMNNPDAKKSKKETKKEDSNKKVSEKKVEVPKVNKKDTENKEIKKESNKEVVSENKEEVITEKKEVKDKETIDNKSEEKKESK